MPTGSGLDSQIGFVGESAWATAGTPTRFIEFNSESMKLEKTWLEPAGLRPGVKHKRISRMNVSRTSVSGDVEFDVATLGMGLLVKHAFASTVTTTTLVAGSAYKQIHTPGDFRGLGLTVQVGRPEPATGTVRPFTYAGCKVTGWEFSIKDNATPMLKLSFDGKSENTATALASASYLAGSKTFTFSQATLKLGGTAATAAGETTITGGTLVSTIVKDFSISGSTPLATDRYGIGNAGQKAEQLENDIPTITGQMGAEFAKTELYDPYTNNTTTAMQFDLTGDAIGANNYLFSIIIPAVKLKNASPTVNGPDIVQMATDFEAGSDETNPVIQIKIVSTESSGI